jgi:hypothetical protein
MNERVNVTSMVSGRVGLVLPRMHINKVWPKKGTKLPVEKDVLREAIYEPGVEYMFKEGLLYIDDMDFKIELGLEQEGTEKPTDIIPVDEKYLTRVLKNMPISEMKAAITKMNDNQKRELIDFASELNDISFDRMDAIKKITGIDVVKVIELKRAKKEEE